MTAGRTPEDQAQIDGFIDEIMAIVASDTGAVRDAITELVERRISEAEQEYERQLKAARTHVTSTWPAHDISTCHQSYCGHYAGQRDGK